MSGLSVIIPSKTASNLALCIEAVQRAERHHVNILPIDDGIDWNQMPDHWRGMGLLGEKPFVYARNVNIGLQAIGASDCVLLNDDALLQTPGGFTAMQKAAEEHPEYGIIGAVTNVTGQPLQQPHGIGLRQVPHFAFVCVLIPRRTINLVGLLDERYCLDYGVEDRDYCEAVTRAGLKVGVYDHCYVDHGSLVSSFRGDPRTPKSFAQNYALFQQKWGII